MTASDHYASPFGAVYSAYMERPRVSHLVARAVWGADIRPYYESMGAIAAVPEGGTIVDCPCGAGPALRGLEPGRSLRYVAADLSPAMLRRARRRAARRGLSGLEFVEASAADLPLPDGCADLFLSYWGLHCFEDPETAVGEAARVLKPGGRLVGAALVRGGNGVRERLLRPGVGDFGPIGTGPEVERWLTGAGFATEIRRSGPMLFLDARVPA